MDKTFKDRISEMIEVVMAVAQGNYAVQIEITENNDELDSLAMGLNMMVEDIKNGMEKEVQQAAAIAAAEKMEIYKLLIETTNTGYVVIDKHGCVVDANNDYVKMTGYPWVNDIIGRPVTEWTAPYETEKHQTAGELCLKQGSIRNFEIDYIRKDGVIVPVEINATVIKNSSGDIELLTLCRDISQRREIEKKLIQATESEKKKADELKALNDQLKAKESALINKVAEIESFNKLMIGRELDMIDLKMEVNSLREKSGLPQKYEVV